MIVSDGRYHGNPAPESIEDGTLVMRIDIAFECQRAERQVEDVDFLLHNPVEAGEDLPVSTAMFIEDLPDYQVSARRYSDPAARGTPAGDRTTHMGSVSVRILRSDVADSTMLVE
jgi:hypothetical protein